MMSKKIFREIEYLLDRAEGRIWGKADNIMLGLYWDIGLCLRDHSEQEVLSLSKELAQVFGVEEKMFAIAYHFYKSNPVKRKALRCAK